MKCEEGKTKDNKVSDTNTTKHGESVGSRQQERWHKRSAVQEAKTRMRQQQIKEDDLATT